MKKVLIITYYFPPAGGPGVQRWLKFVKYLPDFGIEPIVYVPENPSYPIIDKQLLEEVSSKTTILKRRIFEPYALASVFSKTKTKKISSGIIPNERKQTQIDRFLLWVRGNLFIPDARVFWVKPSVSYLKKYIQENQIDTVITTGPPHSLHLIGLRLKEQLSVRWVADFRDPWTTIGYHDKLHLSEGAAQKHRMLEKKVLNTADQIIVTSPSTQAEFEKKTIKPIAVITNGFDHEKVAPQTLDKKFSLAHIGSLLSERNPVHLWQALSDLVKEIPGFADYLQLKLIGTVSKEVLETIGSYNLNEFILNLGYVSHQEALEHQRKSQVLLLIEINSRNTISIIPGKLFEYMISNRPILAIGPRGSDFSEIIQKTNTGVFYDYAAKDEIKKTLRLWYEQFLDQKLVVHAVGVDQYSRQSLTRKLADLLK
ncbi:MAG: glycosyltransferase family 4 protein [Bacteroidetes bacterium]|nr:glycosyltransferase family 4 protein [Bacteroidota bacterium]